MSAWLRRQLLLGKLILLLAAAVGLALLTHVPGAESRYPGKTVLRIEMDNSAPPAVLDTWPQIKAEFEAAHPDTLLICVSTEGNRRMVLEAANMLPDVLASNTFNLYRNRHEFLPLDELLARDRAQLDLDDYYADLVGPCRDEGKLLIVPFMFNVSLLYYNADAFRAANIAPPSDDWSRAEYIAAAQKLNAFDASGKQIRWGTSCEYGWWVEWLTHVRMAGADLIGGDWRSSSMDSPAAIDALSFFHDIALKYQAAPLPREIVAHPFLNQQIAMQFGGHTNDWTSLRRHATFKWDIALLPRGSVSRIGGERVSAGFGINIKSKHQDLAWEFIKHFQSFSVQCSLAEKGLIPVRRSVASQVFFRRGADGEYQVGPPHKERVYEALKYSREQSNLPEFSELALYQAQPEIDAMMRNEITPEECGHRIAQNVTRFLALLSRQRPNSDGATSPVADGQSSLRVASEAHATKEAPR